MSRTLPPDLYGRPRADRLMRALTAVSDAYLPVSTRPRRRRRPAAQRAARLELAVADRRAEAEGVVSLRLAAPDGAALPRWQPGAHLDLHLPSGRRRQYSLCGDPADRTSYRIAVRRIETGGGGSAEVHEGLPVGTRLTVTGPRNAFPFAAEPRVLLIAGGIGITPILPMAREAARRGLDWRLVHSGRSRASLPFADELRQLGGRIEIRPDEEHGTPDAVDLLRRAPAGAAVYACGPAAMLAGLRAAFDTSPAAALHFERFTPPPIHGGRPFELRLARSGLSLPVPADRSALDVLRDAVPAAAYSCRQGFCGVCRQRVLTGKVEHRDRRLTEAERAAGEVLVCVSRAPEGERLVLDL